LRAGSALSHEGDAADSFAVVLGILANGLLANAPAPASATASAVVSGVARGKD